MDLDFIYALLKISLECLEYDTVNVIAARTTGNHE
jgi:hypothetical protein